MKSLLTLALCLLTTLLAAQPLLTGIVDGTQPGGTPKVIELYANGTVDLSQYRLDRYANGASEDPTSLDLTGTFTNSYVYLTNDAAAFAASFGMAGDFANVTETGVASGNGDDVFALVRSSNGATIDVVGNDIGQREQVYTDSYLYRRDGTAANGSWTATDWITPGVDELDGLSAAELGASVPLGTYRPAGGDASVAVVGTTNGSEAGTPATFTITLAPAARAPLTIDYELSGTATPTVDFTGARTGQLTTEGQDTLTVSFPILDDNESEGTETLTFTITGASDTTYSITNASATVDIADNEDLTVMPISEIQGSGEATLLVGETVMVQGIVVANFQGPDGFGGYFIMEERDDWDDNDATSEGIFIADGENVIEVGNLVTVTGVATEIRDLTTIDISAPEASVSVDSTSVALPDPVALSLPLTQDSLESYEGMLVTFGQELTVAELSDFDRFGEFTVTSGGRLFSYTQCNMPDAAALSAFEEETKRRTLLIDDGRSLQNPFPLLFNGTEIGALGGFRSGSVLTDLTGVVDYRFNNYRIQPTERITVRDANERPELAPDDGGDLTVVSANVLNLFNGDGNGGDFPTPRGARTPEDYARQLTKIAAAFVALDADIIGLVEIENDGFDEASTIQDLVDAIANAGGRAYNFVDRANPGDDEITVGLLYDPNVVTESGTAADLVDGNIFDRQRIPLAQTFTITEPGNGSNGQSLTVVVNHFKSKGCSNATGSDTDQDDGAGCFNDLRRRAAEAVLAWLATDPTGVGTDNQLVIGDLNAYRMEDPITTFTDAGWVDAVATAGDSIFPCGGEPSFEFNGAFGSLDYALASPALADNITGADAWNVNAAEPDAFDYSTRFNDPRLYSPDFYRFSDHDPIVVGLSLGTTSTHDPIAAGLNIRQFGAQRLRLQHSVADDPYLLVDTSGRVLLRGRTTAGSTDISILELRRGVYFLNVRGRTFRFVR